MNLGYYENSVFPTGTIILIFSPPLGGKRSRFSPLKYKGMSLTEIGRFAHGAMDSELKISSFDSQSSGLSTTDTDGP